MAGSASNQDIFDVRKIRRLVELMNEHDLNEMDLRQGDMRIQLRRGGPPVIHQAPPPAVLGHSPGHSAPVEPAKAPVEATTTESAPQEEHIALVTSPMVGTFYSAPDPDAAPYVKVGDHVDKETTVCIVEAMKVFNEIPAEISGKVVAVLVEDGAPVEFGQKLFRLEAG